MVVLVVRVFFRFAPPRAKKRSKRSIWKRNRRRKIGPSKNGFWEVFVCSFVFVRVRSCSFVFVFGRFWSPRAAATRTNANGRPQHVQIDFWGVLVRGGRPQHAKTRKRERERPNDHLSIRGFFSAPGPPNGKGRGSKGA